MNVSLIQVMRGLLLAVPIAFVPMMARTSPAQDFLRPDGYEIAISKWMGTSMKIKGFSINYTPSILGSKIPLFLVQHPYTKNEHQISQKASFQQRHLQRPVPSKLAP